MVATAIMGIWDTIKEEFSKGKEQADEKLATRPSQMSEEAHDEANQQAVEMEQEIEPELLLNGMGATRCPIEVIDESEGIQYLLKSVDVDVDGDDAGSVGYTLVTDERIVIAAGKILSGGVGTQHSISYDNVSDISLGQGLFMEVIEVRTPGHEYEITGVDQPIAESIYNYVRKQTQPKQQSSEKDSGDALDKLERLANLRDEGALTEEEFQHKKSELLDDM